MSRTATINQAAKLSLDALVWFELRSIQSTSKEASRILDNFSCIPPLARVGLEYESIIVNFILETFDEMKR